jgi:hypothetical protein
MQKPVGASVLSHGTRSSYVKGCRCNKCRAANAEYIRSRRRVRSGPKENEEVVDATQARQFLQSLSEHGIGRNSVHKASGVGNRLIWNITSGKTKRILRSTEERLLAIKTQEALPRGAIVDSEITLQQIDALVREGFTRGDIADRLHRFSNRLRIGEKNKVRVSSALRINKLYRTLMPDDDEQGEYIDAA